MNVIKHSDIGSASTKKRWLVGLVTNDNWQGKYLAASEANDIISESLTKKGIFLKRKKDILLEEYLKTDAVINNLISAININKKETPIKVIVKSTKQLNVVLLSKKLKPSVDKLVLSKFVNCDVDYIKKIQKHNSHYKNIYYQAVLDFIILKKK